MNDAVVHAKLLMAFRDRYRIIPDYEHVLECDYRRLIGPGDTVFDIGAHEGRHTSVFSEIVGPSGIVWAFEPLPLQFGTLDRLELGPHVRLINAAVSNYSGRSILSMRAARLPKAVSSSAYSTLRIWRTRRPSRWMWSVWTISLTKFLRFTSSRSMLKAARSDAYAGRLTLYADGSRSCRLSMEPSRTRRMGTRGARFLISLSPSASSLVTYSGRSAPTSRPGKSSVTRSTGIGSLFHKSGWSSGRRVY